MAINWGFSNEFLSTFSAWSLGEFFLVMDSAVEVVNVSERRA